MPVNNFAVISPAPRSRWLEIHGSDHNALVTQSIAWLECICASTQASDASRLYEFGNNAAVLPMVSTKNLPAILSSLRSPPHGWGMGGLITHEPLKPDEMQMIFNDLASLQQLSISIRPNPLTSAMWASASHPRIQPITRRAHVIDLSDGFDVVWAKRFEKSTRTAIRKAEKAGLVVECDSTGKFVKAFNELYVKSLDRWGEQQHEPRTLTHWRGSRREPVKKLENIVRFLGPHHRIYMAWLDGVPIAATLLLIGQNAHATRSVMNKELAGPARASDYLHFLAIKDSCEAGCHYFHMGESGSSESLARFKRGFGAEAHEYAEYRLERLPFTALDTRMRQFVKRLIGFRDTTNDTLSDAKQ